MPEIRVKHVVSCSSEDSTHKAENLLKADTYRKWKASKPGEKQISVILQLEKEEQIHSIDIGNEASAFVEVLVGHSTSASEQSFEVILVTSSFMSPSESKNGTNLNRVRMFGPDKLVKATAEKKWDRVKIVCTQPYNKNLVYGLSFLRLHSAPENKEESAPVASSSKLTLLGHFKVKEEDLTGGASLKPGSLFFNRGTVILPKAAPVEKPTPSYAAAALSTGGSCVTDSSTTTADKTATATSPKEGTPGKRKFEFSKEKQSSPAVKRPELKESLKPQPKASSSLPASKKLKTVSVSSPSTTNASTSGRSTPCHKAPVPDNKLKKKKKVVSNPEPVEFHQILQGTVFVLSGFQNPFRGDLRDKALEMGAKYRPDWTPDSTHLICAFKNTPKYNEVKAKGGTIVCKEWILDCYKKKQRLPAKRYLIDGADESSDESEDSEEQEERDIPVSNKKSLQRTAPLGANHKPEKVAINKSSEDEEEKTAVSWESKQKVLIEEKADPEDFGGSTDEEIEGNVARGDYDSGEDTEDELRKVLDANRKGQKEAHGQEEDDPYGGSTDENTDVDEKDEEAEDLSIPELPDFFEGKHFFLYGDFSSNEKRLLIRYITAFSGILEEYMNDKVNYVITAHEWDDSFEEALTENSNLLFVKPRWVYTCNERQKLIPHQPYLVVPQA